MTDQTIPADDVREIVEKMHYHANHDNVRGSEEEYVRFFARQLAELLPAPPLPTLADMTPEERHACRWMQADVDGITGRWLILNPYDEDGDVEVVLESGRKEYFSPDRVTPRPDLPCMSWPVPDLNVEDVNTAKPSPALPDGWRLADHPQYGRVIVTNPTPNRDGRVHFVIPSADPMGFDWLFCHADEMTYLD